MTFKLLETEAIISYPLKVRISCCAPGALYTYIWVRAHTRGRTHARTRMQPKRSEIQRQLQKADLTSVLLTSHYEIKFLNRLDLSSLSSVSTNIPHRLHITYTHKVQFQPIYHIVYTLPTRTKFSFNQYTTSTTHHLHAATKLTTSLYHATLRH